MIRRAVFAVLSWLFPYRCDREAIQRRCLQAHLDNATMQRRW